MSKASVFWRRSPAPWISLNSLRFSLGGFGRRIFTGVSPTAVASSNLLNSDLEPSDRTIFQPFIVLAGAAAGKTSQGQKRNPENQKAEGKGLHRSQNSENCAWNDLPLSSSIVASPKLTCQENGLPPLAASKFLSGGGRLHKCPAMALPRRSGNVNNL